MTYDPATITTAVLAGAAFTWKILIPEVSAWKRNGNGPSKPTCLMASEDFQQTRIAETSRGVADHISPIIEVQTEILREVKTTQADVARSLTTLVTIAQERKRR